jgi:tRNA G18 (ribose-2'-O)-methylase SpoU
MRVVRIDRSDDPRLEDYRNVSDSELMRRRSLFMAEGRLIVGRLLDAGHDVRSLLLNQSSFAALEAHLHRLRGDIPVYICETRRFADITGFNLHRGCLALAARPAERDAADLMQAPGVLLVLEGVADADNVGSAFRNAAAFGAAAVLLSPTCCDPLYRKAIRTSMGAVLRVPFARLHDWPGDLARLRTRGFTIVALTPDASSIELDTCARRGRDRSIALLVGTEGRGLSGGALALADLCVRIRMSPGIDSLNLATAAGIALHHFASPESRITNHDAS